MRIRRYTKNRRGAGIVEYGLIVGLIAVGAIVAVDQSGKSIRDLVQTVAGELSGVSNTVVNSADAGAGDSAGDSAGAGGGAGAPRPTGCAASGDVCDDGTVYVGNMTEVGGADRDLYAMPADLAGEFSWNNGTTDFLDADADDLFDGAANTAWLVAATNASAPYNAAGACHGASLGGHAWHLPADRELSLLMSHSGAVGGFATSYYYWASTDSTYADHRGAEIRLPDNHESQGQKDHDRLVRCVVSFAN